MYEELTITVIEKSDFFAIETPIQIIGFGIFCIIGLIGIMEMIVREPITPKEGNSEAC